MTDTRRLRALLAAGLVCLCLAGCAKTSAASAPKDPPYRVAQGGTYVPGPTAELEYSLEASTLRLPAGHAWPQHPVPKPPSGTPEWYQLGYARQAADRYWFCSWASVAAGATDPKARHAAVLRLQDITRLYYFTNALDGPSKPPLVTELATARRGDLTALRNDLRLNC